MDANTKIIYNHLFIPIDCHFVGALKGSYHFTCFITIQPNTTERCQKLKYNLIKVNLFTSHL